MAEQRAYISSAAGTKLSADEARLFREAPPAGLILFARNCHSAAQVRRLIADFRAAAGTEQVLVLVDQEGGRVQRLKPPLARLLPPAAAFRAHFPDDLAEACRAAQLLAQLAGAELKALGIEGNCAPVLDVPVAGAHDVIGNRAYDREPAAVTALGLAVADGLMAAGVLPVMKHVPGHGRARADSHLELPVVTATRAELEASDLVPFRGAAHLPAAMTAHVLYPSLDRAAPASVSAAITRDIIRGQIGFDGLLMSDDIGMKALAGSLAERTRAVIGAGSDLVLHCSGNLAEMREVAAAAPALDGRAAERLAAALAIGRAVPRALDMAMAERLRAQIVGRTA